MNAPVLVEALKKATPTITSSRRLVQQPHAAFAERMASMSASPGMAERDLWHDLSRVSIHPPTSQPVAQSCPLVAGPRACPFGGACHACPTQVQAKLSVGQPDDVYEQEADRFAEQALRATGPQAQAGAADSGTTQPATVPRAVPEALSSPGRPLDSATRAFMEPRFGHELSAVRIHTDAKAADSAMAVGALAYTVGPDVVFGAGQYSPTTSHGRRLLAHELTHVVQQESAAHNSPIIQFQRYKDCTPEITGAAKTQAEIDNLILGSRMAGQLLAMVAEGAVRSVRGGTGLPAQSTALANHFGAPTPAQIDIIASRFGRISHRLANDRLFICNTADSFYCRRGWCAYATCPGAGYSTHLCPLFFQTPCADTELTVIHEAAHAAGACEDIYPGAGYPPANAHNNAPSYEAFANAVFTIV